jgi:hypothetical protein
MEPWRNQIAQMGMKKAGGGFNPYAAGEKQYGITGRNQATQGPVSAQGQQGYAQRDQEQNARKSAVLKRMQAAQNGNYMSSDYLWGVK